MPIHRSAEAYVTVKVDVIQRITNPVALSIWLLVLSSPESTPDSIKRHFSISREKYALAMRHLKGLGLVKYQSLHKSDGRMNGQIVHMLWGPLA